MTSTAAIQLSHCRAIEEVQQSLERAAIVRSDGKSASIKSISEHHTLLRVDLTDAAATAAAVRQADPDLVMHLAAESHVDRSIEGPGAYGSTAT